ncbi:hypothetical protein FIBSPDRAFT_509838 [Athelia psychrophila]|uniref:F-box domain-containing protein n=1 Tax=Athelia psychrophila TaxID=1759441 RepID=A0A166JZB4_9AGAM|nr:hypothetical protein FIBSPDRAFT_509838 [Fibularhizoctonia sp. CBS 109695]
MSTILANTWSVTCTLLGYIPKSLYGRILRKRLHLLSLPMELLEEVVKNLGWLELLRVRITCKTLNDISKIRSVRVHLIKRAQACDPYHTPMDRAVEHYTPDELEDWAMRRLALVDRWPPTCAQQSFRQRSAYLTNGAEQTILLPGGRWLVSSLKEGGLVVTDLDSPEMRHQSIWEPQEDVVSIWRCIALTLVNLQSMAFASNYTFVGNISRQVSRSQRNTLPGSAEAGGDPTV